MADVIELNDDTMTAELEKHPVALVDFYATWCGSCRMAAPMFKRVAESQNLPFFKIDAEKNEKCRSMVKIESLPTLAIAKNGTFVGSLSTSKEEAVREFLKEHGVGA